MANSAELIKSMKTIFKGIFPELNGYHFPIRAKVVKVHENGGRVDEYHRLYSVDVQPLSKDGSLDASQPVIPDVELPVLWGGDDRGVYCLPDVGTVVRVAYYYNDPSQPFVDAILPDGCRVPSHSLGSLRIRQRDGFELEFTADGQVRISADKIHLQHSGAGSEHPLTFADVVASVFNGHTHPTPDGESGPPSQPMTGHASSTSYTV